MHPSYFWPNLIRDLLRERGMSVRELCTISGTNRAYLTRFFKGQSSLRINRLEAILGVLGYELDAIKKVERDAV